MRWNFIPDFELAHNDPDKSNNPWETCLSPNPDPVGLVPKARVGS